MFNTFTFFGAIAKLICSTVAGIFALDALFAAANRLIVVTTVAILETFFAFVAGGAIASIGMTVAMVVLETFHTVVPITFPLVFIVLAVIIAVTITYGGTFGHADEGCTTLLAATITVARTQSKTAGLIGVFEDPKSFFFLLWGHATA